MKEYLFTYGTLSPGESNAHILADVAGEWESASVQGKVFYDGKGSAMGYPGIILAAGPEKVSGFLFSSEALSAQWQRLDEFEGDGYSRVLTTVTRGDNSQIQANIYALVTR